MAEKKTEAKAANSAAAPTATAAAESKPLGSEAPTPEAAKMWRLAGDFLSGKATIAEVMNFSMEEVYSLAELGYRYMQEGNLEEAMRIFQVLVAINPKDPYLHVLLGSALQRSGKKDDAIAEYSKAVGIEKSMVEAYANRGELLLEKGELKAAMTDFKKACELDPEDKIPATLRARAILAVTAAKMQQRLAEEKGGAATAGAAGTAGPAEKAGAGAKPAPAAKK